MRHSRRAVGCFGVQLVLLSVINHVLIPLDSKHLGLLVLSLQCANISFNLAVVEDVHVENHRLSRSGFKGFGKDAGLDSTLARTGLGMARALFASGDRGRYAWKPESSLLMLDDAVLLLSAA